MPEEPGPEREPEPGPESEPVSKAEPEPGPELGSEPGLEELKLGKQEVLEPNEPEGLMGKLKKSCSERVGVPIASLRLLSDDKRINDVGTPKQWEMKTDDVLEVYQELEEPVPKPVGPELEPEQPEPSVAARHSTQVWRMIRRLTTTRKRLTTTRRPRRRLTTTRRPLNPAVRTCRTQPETSVAPSHSTQKPPRSSLHPSRQQTSL